MKYLLVEKRVLVSQDTTCHYLRSNIVLDQFRDVQGHVALGPNQTLRTICEGGNRASTQSAHFPCSQCLAWAAASRRSRMSARLMSLTLASLRRSRKDLTVSKTQGLQNLELLIMDLSLPLKRIFKLKWNNILVHQSGSTLKRNRNLIFHPV